MSDHASEDCPVDQHVLELRQISVFLENRPGNLAELATMLAGAGIDLRALTIAETERFGIVRLIADDTDRALTVLREAGFASRVTTVYGIQVPDRPGGLAHVLALFDAQVSVEYMYADLKGVGTCSLMIMKLEPAEVALKILADAGLS